LLFSLVIVLLFSILKAKPVEYSGQRSTIKEDNYKWDSECPYHHQRQISSETQFKQ